MRVLLSGPAARRLEGSLDDHPGLSLISMGAQNGTRADVALHVLDPSSATDIAQAIRELRELTDVPLILAAYGEPNGIVETGLEVGAVDVLVLPQPAETVLFALRKAALAATGREAGKVVTVFSPKGGSGKTVLATNLAAACAATGIRTLLVDLDLQSGDSALTLSVAPKATISDLAASAGRVDAEKLNAFVITDPRTGVALLPAPKRPEEAEVVGQEELAAVLQAARASYEAIVIDTGPLFDRALLAALDHTDRLLLVCNPEVTSLKNVRIGLETIDRLGFPRDRMSLVANRMGATGGVSRDDIEQALDAQIIYELPDDPVVPASINRALPVVAGDEGSKFGRAVIKVGNDLFGSPGPQRASRERRHLLRGRR
ncbi:MAG TPA: AAA family ATPase [Gaiellaceae bacterium]|nr:AAA family ATPase [Gaiellaceae bacterium]